MWRPEWEQYIRIINDKVVPSLGCTEPISTAYATALAVELLNRTPEQITVLVSGNLMKNGMGVGVRVPAWWACRSRRPSVLSGAIPKPDWKY